MAGTALGLGLGLQRGAAGASTAITGIVLSDSETDDGASVGALVGTLFMVGGVEPATFTLTSNPDSLWQIDGDRLEVAASLAGKGGTQESPVVKVTDALGQEFEAVLPITIAETEGSNDSGVVEDDVDVVTPDPDDPDADTGGFEATPIVQDTSDGLKIAGKNGGSATFLLDWGVPVAGATVTMKYDPDWSGMNKQGREAAVGFAFKSGNSFHLASLRGNGANPASLRKSKVYGDFRKSNQFTLTNDGAASHGTKDGPNWLQIEFAEDGETYTLRSSADGETWTDEYTDAVPAPLTNATDALQFGPGAYFTNSDKGVFSIVIEQWVADGFASFITATGGTITTDGNYKVHTFTSSGDFEITAGSGDVEYLIVAGGGGGGSRSGAGGGGAGGLLTGTSLALATGIYPVVVGAGGAGRPESSAGPGSDGSASSFNSISASGGGGGGEGALASGTDSNGRAGGSGGGGGRFDGAGQRQGGAGTVGQGNDGGDGQASGTVRSGGGGGAGGAGANAASGATGGAGTASSITGAALTYAVGGQGGKTSTTNPGGRGGGGAAVSGTNGTAGGANTGGGGGGGGLDGVTGGAGGNGGSGVVILRYQFQ